MIKRTHQIIFWVVIFLFLIVLFGRKWENHIDAFYFTTMLMPVAIGTSYFFNYFLVPRYMLTQRYWRFGLYTYYTVVISLFMSEVIAMFSFVILSNLTLSEMNPVAWDVVQMGLIIYFVVFLFSFIHLFQSNAQNRQQLLAEKEKNLRETLTVRSNRQTITLPMDQIYYIESLADYVKIVSDASPVITREKISHLQNRLPSQFVRCHRSYLVNQNHIENYAHDHVTVNGVKIPIGRKFKSDLLSKLQ